MSIDLSLVHDVRSLTRALATADPKQFEALTRPAAGSGAHLGTLCGFISALAEEGVDVEAVTVAAPDVDVAAARRLAESLGASSFRTREYFP